MSRIVTLCDGIVSQLTAKGSPIAQLLKPGLALSELHELEGGLPFVLPSSCVEMYTWHNGTELVSGSTFFPWWVFDAITESVDRYRILATGEDDVWDSTWFPLFSASDISSIGIACESSRTPDGPIHRFEYLCGSFQEYLSLETMLETILVACERGIIFWDEKERELDQDDEGFARVASGLNPGLDRWSQEK
jgi:hypothetical protein